MPTRVDIEQPFCSALLATAPRHIHMYVIHIRDSMPRSELAAAASCAPVTAAPVPAPVTYQPQYQPQYQHQCDCCALATRPTGIVRYNYNNNTRMRPSQTATGFGDWDRGRQLEIGNANAISRVQRQETRQETRDRTEPKTVQMDK